MSSASSRTGSRRHRLGAVDGEDELGEDRTSAWNIPCGAAGGGSGRPRRERRVGAARQATSSCRYGCADDFGDSVTFIVQILDRLLNVQPGVRRSCTPPPAHADHVAQAVGVSRQTVSNMLNAPDLVHAKTRGRVEAEIADQGYPPTGPRSPCGSAARFLGYCVPPPPLPATR